MTGPLMLVLGLSGTALVFRPELEPFVNGTPTVMDLQSSATSHDRVVALGSGSSGTPRGGVVALDRIVLAALAHYPAAEPLGLRLPAEPNRPYRVEMIWGRQRFDVAVDPYTLQVIGARAAERSVLLAVQSLHAGFHAGRTGALAVGILGLWVVVESATGFWLCWPSAVRRPAVGVPWREGRRSRSLHRLVGGLSLALGVLVGLTGAALALASAFALGAPRDVIREGAGGGLARLDMIAARAEAALPGGRITALTAQGDHTVRVEKRLPLGTGGTRLGAVIIDRNDGQIIAVRPDQHGLSPWELLRRLHYGDFAGSISRIAWAFVGLALPFLSVTGYLISARRGA